MATSTRTTKRATTAAKQATVAQPAVKVAVPRKAIAKPAAKAAAAPAMPKARADAKAAAKPAKDKLVRDSFTIPASEYAMLAQLKQRSVALAQPAKKSEVLRAGLKALAALDDAALKAALAQVPTVKTGRPKAKKGAKKA
ncbi:hypothetical protein [Ideonella sp. BN130291]|uniref:hypothetical protein n=1 Tax=Ideonella sp. BN130291 TaxID=3112940 RepID=UPI002E26380B|nr:hypothetical protein [Ideonella sp. BN130291]